MVDRRQLLALLVALLGCEQPIEALCRGCGHEVLLGPDGLTHRLAADGTSVCGEVERDEAREGDGPRCARCWSD